jgi:hypothetical protein
MDAHAKGLVLGFGLVMLSIVIAIVARQFLSGRSGFSRLEKSLELPLNKLNQHFHQQAFLKRLEILGFKSAGADGQFIQGGADLAEFGAASHAKTKKMFSFQFKESGPDKILALVTLRYLDIVVVDTGEAAYRDAVLDFVTGKTDEMASVPTESLMALNSLIGGAAACCVAVALVVSDKVSLWTAIPSLGVTEFAVGLLALFSISRKPAEITGRWKAVVGIVLSMFAISLGLFFIISTRSSPP